VSGRLGMVVMMMVVVACDDDDDNDHNDDHDGNVMKQIGSHRPPFSRMHSLIPFRPPRRACTPVAAWAAT
jgi:hypothetical protein